MSGFGPDKTLKSGFLPRANPHDDAGLAWVVGEAATWLPFRVKRGGSFLDTLKAVIAEDASLTAQRNDVFMTAARDPPTLLARFETSATASPFRGAEAWTEAALSALLSSGGVIRRLAEEVSL